MALALMLVLQAAVPPAAPGPSAPPVPRVSAAPTAIDFDLARYRPAGAGTGLIGRGCRGDDPTPIVVCARRSGGAYPIEEMARLFAIPPLVAEMSLGGAATGRVYGEAVELAPGMVSQRLMVGRKGTVTVTVPVTASPPAAGAGQQPLNRPAFSSRPTRAGDRR